MISRRSLLAAGAGLAASALLGCAETGPRFDGIVAELPDAEMPASPHGDPRAVIDPKSIVVPPPPQPKQLIQSSIGEIMPRSAWTRSGPDTSRVRPMDGVRLITFHHSGDGTPFYGESVHDVAAHLEIVRQFHRKKNFNDIAYHFAIDRAGRVWQLRSLALEGQHVRPGHVNGKVVRWNEHNVGVVVLGDFNRQAPSALQKLKIVSAASWLHKQFSLPPSAVKTHRELVDTDCPGKALQPYLDAVRKQRLI